MSAIDQIRAITSDVIRVHEGNGSTHYETCYLHHPGCLALLIHRLADDGEEAKPLPLDPEPWLCTYAYCTHPGLHREATPGPLRIFLPGEEYDQEQASYEGNTDV